MTSAAQISPNATSRMMKRNKEDEEEDEEEKLEQREYFRLPRLITLSRYKLRYVSLSPPDPTPAERGKRKTKELREGKQRLEAPFV